jgi:hypothetical protein
MNATYIMPIRQSSSDGCVELASYLNQLAPLLQTIVVDGSPEQVFAALHQRLHPSVVHIRPAPERQAVNGKVAGVLTGVDRAGHDHLIIADDDVRYDEQNLRRMIDLLHSAEVVRPQNYFSPLPWHARVDTARSLLNRISGGDWPGTLGVRRSVLWTTGGYDGDVLFENLELVRTVRAAGGREKIALDLFVRRAPAATGHFWAQRTRQAYDELARPIRLVCSLAILPGIGLLLGKRRWSATVALTAVSIALAELGRRRGGGESYFPASCSFLAPVWLLERAVFIWLALGARVFLGGVPYRGARMRRAATPMRILRQRHGMAHAVSTTG